MDPVSLSTNLRSSTPRQASIASRIFRRWLDVPPPLKVLTLNLSLGGVVIMISSLGGASTFQAYGVDPATGEVLGRGVGVLLGATMGGMAFMIYRGWPWVRHLLMGLVVLIVVSPIFRREEPETPSLIFIAVAMLVIFGAFRYFYRSPKMIRYFTASNR